MAAQHTQIATNKNEYRWSFRKKGKDVLKLCRQLTVVVTVAGGLTIIATPAQANPSGGNVTAGSATITSSGTTTTIHQTSGRAIIEWSNFDIAAGETTQFIQPSTSAIALNRVVNSNQATSINGNLTANGRVLVINPNGVLIGQSGNVDVSGFVASTADIDNTRFMTANGAMEFDRAGKLDASVENQGRITIRDAGLGLLVAPVVRNSGVIEGNMAKLQMGAGDTFGVDMYGDGLLHLAVGNTGAERTIKAENTGTIVAQAGKVVMTAAAANNVVNSVINTSGVIEAKALVNKGGEIILTGAGAKVQVAGKVDASGKTGGGTVKIGGDVQGADTLAKAKTVDVAANAQISADAGTAGDGGTIAVWSDELTTSRGSYSAKGGSESGNGGFVETSSKETLDVAGTYVDTSTAFGAYGKWLLDPYNLTVDAALANTIGNSNSNVWLDATNDITVSSDINMTKSGVGLTLYATFGDIKINNHNITLNGGNLRLDAGGEIDVRHSDIVTKGGNVNFYSAWGGIKINNSNINTTGGNTTADVAFYEGTFRPEKSFGNVFNTANSTLKKQGKAGNVTMSADTISGNSVCIAAGGSGCGVAPASINLAIRGNDVYKTYGSLDPALTYTVSAGALMSGDNFTGALVRAAGNNVGTYAINQGTLNVVSSGGYTYVITYTPGTFTINPAFLTITAQNQGKTYGDTLNLGTTGFTTSGLVAGDSVTGVNLSSAGAAATANAGTYVIGASGATGTGLGNYQITYQDGTLTVGKAALTMTANSYTKTYGDTLNILSPTLATFSGLKNGDTVGSHGISYSGTHAQANVGTYDVNPFLPSNSTLFANYNVTYVKGAITVTPAALNVIIGNQSKTYGDAHVLGNTNFTYSGLKSWDSISAVNLSSAGAVATANAGNYAISGSGATGSGLSNYTINYVDGNLLVNKAALTIAANNQTKVYGDAMNYDNGGFATVTGLKNNDTVDSTNGQVMGGFQPTGAVGTYDINVYGASGTGLSNYDITFVKGVLTVTPAALIIAANNQTKVYGDAMNYNNGPYTVTGLKNADTVDTTWGQVMGGFQTNANVGSYDINIYGASGNGLSNYTITFVKGTLTVTPAALTIIASNQGKTYGDAHTLGTTAFTSSGLKSWDSISGVELSSAGAAATANAGNYAITANHAAGTGLGNYTINYVNGNLNVAKAALTVTANNRSKTYGDTLAMGNSAFTTSGLKNSDTVNTVNLSSSGRTAGANVGNYNITASNAAGVGLGNYTITYVKGTLVVNPATLTITARDQYKVYGDSKNVDSALLPVTVSGLKNFDFVSGINLTSSGGAATASVGGYDIVANGATGWGLSNYNINYVNGTLHVTPALLVITADSFSKTYGDLHTFDNSDYGVYGLKNADTVTGVNLASNGAAATANVGLYGIFGSNATGTGLSNYNIIYTPGLMLINPAALSVTALDQSKTYGANHDLGNTAFAVSGLKNSDTVDTVALNSNGAAGTANAGSYAITSGGASGSGLSNYVISYNSGTLTVNQANLSVVANNQTKNFGSPFTFNGTEFTTVGTLYNGDTVNTVTLTSPGEAANASAIFSPYNIYASNATGTGLGNYNITYVNGQMTVNPAPYTPNVTFDSLNRPIVSVANKVIVRDTAFEGYETQTGDVDVALRYRGNTPTTTAGNAAAVLAALEPAAGGDDVSAEDLANLEPAAGGDDTPAASGNSDVDCANSFLDNQPCGLVQ